MQQTSEKLSSGDDVSVLHGHEAHRALEHLWARLIAISRARTVTSVTEAEWVSEQVLLSGLGLALEETMQFVLRKQPGFDEFERWVLERSQNLRGSDRLSRLDAALSGAPYDESVRASITAIDAMDDVLNADDLAHWAEHGYVVLRNAIPGEQCEATIASVLRYIGATLDDPTSWYRFPDQRGVMVQLFHDAAMQANRESPRIHKAFAQLWGTADLWVTTDRAGFNPPETAEYTFAGPNLHWDMSLVPPIAFGTQGVLYLTDTEADQGAFTCLPGLHRTLETWLATLAPDADPRGAELEGVRGIPVAAGAGDMVIWHQALPHGGSPNRGTSPRIVQYINMFPTKFEYQTEWR